MPLFVNDFVSPQVFSNQQKVEEPENQAKFHLNYLHEVLNEQEQLNNKLSGSVIKFENTFQENRQEQLQQFKSLFSSLAKQETISEKVIENIYEQKESTSDLDEKITKLEKMQEQLSKTFLNEELTNQAILDQLACQQSMIVDLNRKLLEYEDVTKSLVIQEQKQELLQNMVKNHMDLQGVYHETVMEQLCKQDAVGERISDQLSEIKNVHSNMAKDFLEKLENHYSKWTSFLFSFILPNIRQQKKIIKKEKSQKEH